MKTTLRAIIVLVVCAVTGAQADTHYVAHNGQTPSGSFTDWNSAASNIQDAVNAATTNDTVLVGAGRYTVPPNATNYNGTNVVYINKPLTLSSSNGLPETTIIDGEGTNRGVATYYPVNSTYSFIISGITISNCFATNTGGGVLFDDSLIGGEKHCALINCVIQNNVSAGTAGGVRCGTANNTYNYFAASNCVFRGNRAVGNGGAIAKEFYGSADICGCLIESNSAQYGGGLYFNYGAPQVSNCIIRCNTVTGTSTAFGGGGVLVAGVAGGWLRNCLIYNNVAYSGGGVAVRQTTTTFAIQNCTIVSNTASSQAGGIAVVTAANIAVSDSIIYSNSSDIITVGGSYANFYSTNNCTSSTNNLSAVGNTGNITKLSAVRGFRGAEFPFKIHVAMHQNRDEPELDEWGDGFGRPAAQGRHLRHRGYGLLRICDQRHDVHCPVSGGYMPLRTADAWVFERGCSSRCPHRFSCSKFNGLWRK